MAVNIPSASTPRAHLSEHEPLLVGALPNPEPAGKLRVTPLPLGQLSIVLYMRFCQSVAVCFLEPFLNELLLKFAGGDQATVAYLLTILEIAAFASSLLTIMFWSRLSDRIGRKPIIIFGSAAIATSALLVGLSREFWILITSRIFYLGLNNNEALIRCVVGEITDDTNSATAFSLLHIPWAVGMTLGPLVGGYLANPNSRFPERFSGKFWLQFPYLLPSGIITTITLLGLITVCIWFRETLPRRPSPFAPSSSETSARDKPQSMDIRSLLTSRVILTTTNYFAFSGVQTACSVIQPLFLAMSVSVGGLGLDPAQIGLIQSARGITSSVIQWMFLGFCVRKFGLRPVFVTAIAALAPTLFLFPVMNIQAMHYKDSSTGPGIGIYSWLLLVIQSGCFCIADCGFACLYIYITKSAPSKGSLGSINGITQVPVTLARLLGSTFAAFMLGVSIEKKWMGGYAVYVLLSIMTCVCVVVARRLPRDGWEVDSMNEADVPVDRLE